MTKPKPTWPRVRFGDVVRLNKDRSADPAADGIERYVAIEHIEPEDLRIRNWGLVAEGTTFTQRIRPGQTLFVKRRAYQRKVAVAEFDAVCSGDIYVLEPKDDRLLPELLPFLCQTDAFFEYAVNTSAGSLSPRTNWTQLAQYEFVLPPLAEQRRMARIFFAIENALESHKNLLIECRKLQSSLTEERLQQNQEGWIQIPLTDLCSIQTGKLDSNAAVENGEYPFFTCDPEVHRIDTYAFDCDAILLAGNNAQGNFWVKTYTGKFNAYQRTYVLEISDKQIARTSFVAMTLNRSLYELKARAIGSTTRYLTLKILAKVMISIPSIEVQNEIIKEHSLLERMCESIETRRNQLSGLKQQTLQCVEG